MEYAKPPLTFEAQAAQLIERGLIADQSEIIHRLKSVNYYRLAGYLHPFRLPDSDSFRNGTNLDTVWRRYCFDRRLRDLFLDAIERIEVATRTKLVYHFAHAHGPFGYCHEDKLPKMKIEDYLEWRQNLQIETSRSKEVFKKHFTKKYGDSHKSLPLWMLCELMSMGSMLSFYKGVEGELKQKVAADFGLTDKLMESWLRSLYNVRNLCAHHARLWNKTLGCPPIVPKESKLPDWPNVFMFRNDRCGIALVICRQFLKLISPTSQWHRRTDKLFEEYPEIPIKDMGLPENWQEHPVWKEKK